MEEQKKNDLILPNRSDETRRKAAEITRKLYSGQITRNQARLEMGLRPLDGEEFNTLQVWIPLEKEK